MGLGFCGLAGLRVFVMFTGFGGFCPRLQIFVYLWIWWVNMNRECVKFNFCVKNA